MLRALNRMKNRWSNHIGLSQSRIKKFKNNHELQKALTSAQYTESENEFQSNIENFYTDVAKHPYVPISGQGPWVVTSDGGVIHDSGGYGMLGWGHNPIELMNSLRKDQVMANIMTQNPSQQKFTDALLEEIGHNRDDQPLSKFMFLNSGSEAMSLANRITDTHVKKCHSDKRSVRISLEKSFHGRTYRAAQLSDSTMKSYKGALASFSQGTDVLHVPCNNVSALEDTFKYITDNNLALEGMFIEPTMGEGKPGIQISVPFYECAREGTLALNSVLVMDSIQAGMRATGTLSFLDSPGFEKVKPCDMEIYSKAINGGQFPLSVLALGERMHGIYEKGTYGNTMTGNPRAMDIGTASLQLMTEDNRTNIRVMGSFLKSELEVLQAKHPDVITEVTGTGLLVAAHIHPSIPVLCDGETSGLELLCRKKGLGVIHGGQNALRFTPHFRITEPEVHLMTEILDEVICDLSGK